MLINFTDTWVIITVNIQINNFDFSLNNKWAVSHSLKALAIKFSIKYFSVKYPD